jgi:hypothetical protein
VFASPVTRAEAAAALEVQQRQALAALAGRRLTPARVDGWRVGLSE